jgi:hypothetical protein
MESFDSVLGGLLGGKTGPLMPPRLSRQSFAYSKSFAAWLNQSRARLATISSPPSQFQIITEYRPEIDLRGNACFLASITHYPMAKPTMPSQQKTVLQMGYCRGAPQPYGRGTSPHASSGGTLRGVPSVGKATEGTHRAFIHGFTPVGFCKGG